MAIILYMQDQVSSPHLTPIRDNLDHIHCLCFSIRISKLNYKKFKKYIAFM